MLCPNTYSQSIRKLSIKLRHCVLNNGNLTCDVSRARNEKIILDYIFRHIFTTF